MKYSAAHASSLSYLYWPQSITSWRETIVSPPNNHANGVCECVWFSLIIFTTSSASLFAPASNKSFTVAVWPPCEAFMSAVSPSYMQREKGHTPKSKWDEEAAVAAKHIASPFSSTVLPRPWRPCQPLPLRGPSQLRCDRWPRHKWALWIYAIQK